MGNGGHHDPDRHFIYLGRANTRATIIKKNNKWRNKV
jgi:hypothetical protein